MLIVCSCTTVNSHLQAAQMLQHSKFACEAKTKKERGPNDVVTCDQCQEWLHKAIRGCGEMSIEYGVRPLVNQL